jgi:hypothetical protein
MLFLDIPIALIFLPALFGFGLFFIFFETEAKDLPQSIN